MSRLEAKWLFDLDYYACGSKLWEESTTASRKCVKNAGESPVTWYTLFAELIIASLRAELQDATGISHLDKGKSRYS